VNILLIDLEGTTNKLVYDIGFIVAKQEEDMTFTEVYKEQFIIEEIFDNRELFDTAYYHKKRPKYYGLLRANNTTSKVKLKVALARLRHIINHYDIDIVTAYNSSYDVGAMEKTTDYYNKANPIAELNDVCIYALAGKYIHSTEDYQKWCEDNNYYTDKGYYSTNAEITYRYITGKINFVEDHTGLKDCEIELEILNYILINGGKFEKVDKTFHKSDVLQRLTVMVNGKVYNFAYKQKYTRGGKITLTK